MLTLLLAQRRESLAPSARGRVGEVLVFRLLRLAASAQKGRQLQQRWPT